MAYEVRRTEPGLWTLFETWTHDGEICYESMEDFNSEAEAKSELHRCIYGTPLIPDAADEPTVDDRLKMLEVFVDELRAQNANQAKQIKALANRLSNLSRYAEDMPGGAELDY